MPASLMTAIFSTNVKGLENAYNAKTYWVSFAIVIFLSLILLAVFGKLSDTLEGKPIYKSMTQTFYDQVKMYKRR